MAKHLAQAARSARQAMVEAEKAFQTAKEGSDDEARCSEAIQGLEAALWLCEWTPDIGEALAERETRLAS